MVPRAPAAALLALLAMSSVAGCSPRDSGCPAGHVLCGGCYDPARFLADPDNCGGCGIQCGSGATCSSGACQCPPGSDLCAALTPRCRDLRSDPEACGSCTTSCNLLELGWTCEAGACGCFGDRTECGTVCTNTAVDPHNCGACANACKRNQACESSVCTCPPSFPTDCPTACANAQTDPTNCGGCGNVCTVEGEVCSSGQCACPPALPDRCPDAAPTECVNRGTDARNCGTCGNACPAGAACVGGSCRCPADQLPCGGACVPCAGGACVGGACRCATGPGSGCSGRCCEGGDACCPGGGCQTKHSNGLGQFYFDCNPLYAPGQTTEAAARLAADAWSTGVTFSPFCDGFCVARQTGSECAVWCFAPSNLAGRVNRNAASVACICPSTLSPFWN